MYAVCTFSRLFETTYATSNNSFSKVTKWILMLFGAKWRRDLACFVSLLYCSLLLSWKRRKLRTKQETVFRSSTFLYRSEVCAAGRSWASEGKMSPKNRNYWDLWWYFFSYQNKQLNRQALRFSALSEQNRSCGAYTSPKPRLWTAYRGTAMRNFMA